MCPAAKERKVVTLQYEIGVAYVTGGRNKVAVVAGCNMAERTRNWLSQ